MVHKILTAMGVKHGLMFRHKNLRHIVPLHGVLNKLKKLHGRGGFERKGSGPPRVPYPKQVASIEYPMTFRPKVGGKARHVLQFR